MACGATLVEQHVGLGVVGGKGEGWRGGGVEGCRGGGVEGWRDGVREERRVITAVTAHPQPPSKRQT